MLLEYSPLPKRLLCLPRTRQPMTCQMSRWQPEREAGQERGEVTFPGPGFLQACQVAVGPGEVPVSRYHRTSLAGFCVLLACNCGRRRAGHWPRSLWKTGPCIAWPMGTAAVEPAGRQLGPPGPVLVVAPLQAGGRPFRVPNAGSRVFSSHRLPAVPGGMRREVWPQSPWMTGPCIACRPSMGHHGLLQWRLASALQLQPLA